jgi:dolichyl-phosphate-mannose--protein O-mannosyl transferase
MRKTKKWYYTTAAVIFSVIGIVHFARALYGWEAMVGGVNIPIWMSWVAVMIAIFLAFRGFQLGAEHSQE